MNASCESDISDERRDVEDGDEDNKDAEDSQQRFQTLEEELPTEEVDGEMDRIREDRIRRETPNLFDAPLR